MTIVQFNQLDADSIHDIGIRFKLPQTFIQAVTNQDIFITLRDDISYQVIFKVYEDNTNSTLRLFLQSPQQSHEIIYCYTITGIKDVSENEEGDMFDIYITSSNATSVLKVNAIPINQTLPDSKPSSTTGSYTTPRPVPYTIGGIVKGTTFINTSFNKVLDTLLFPNSNPIIDQFIVSPTTLELGQVLNTLTITWNISNAIAIKENSITLTLHGQVIQTRLNRTDTKTYSLTDKFLVPTTRDITLSVTDVNTNEVITKSLNIEWKRDLYYGSSNLEKLTNANNLTQVITNDINGDYKFQDSGYKYFLIPVANTQSFIFMDKYTTLGVSMTQLDPISITNKFGIETKYNVYRTTYKINANISITLKGE